MEDMTELLEALNGIREELTQLNKTVAALAAKPAASAPARTPRPYSNDSAGEDRPRRFTPTGRSFSGGGGFGGGRSGGRAGGGFKRDSAGSGEGAPSRGYARDNDGEGGGDRPPKRHGGGPGRGGAGGSGKGGFGKGKPFSHDKKKTGGYPKKGGRPSH